MESETKQCKKCSEDFLIDENDQIFYNRISVPIPDFCPTCRQQWRMLFRNFKTLYKRKSDKSGKMIISMYNPDAKFPVWDIPEWYADDWNAMDYGIDYDSNRSFLDQLSNLFNKVPHFALMNTKSTNCEYSNFTWKSNNCYFVFGCVEDEACDYGHIVWNSTDCVDNLYVHKSELCYECIDCRESNRLLYSQECEACVDSIGLYDCRGCTNCIGCVGLRQQSYQIFNQPVSKKEYNEFLDKYPINDEASIIYILNKQEELRKKIPTRATYGSHNNNVSGDHVYNARNVHHSFDSQGGENSKYCYTTSKPVETYDISFNPYIEYSYQSLASVASSNLISGHLIHDSNHVYYSDTCMNSKNLFGCFGLRNKEYCILNRQYTKEEYEELTPHIIESMKKTGDWGNFFKLTMTPFSYNESIANEYMPLKKDEALAQGFSWRDDIPSTKDQENYTHKELPQDPKDYSDDLLDKIFKCEFCEKNYKLISREIAFYKRIGLSVPRKCFNCRHQRRMDIRNSRNLIETKCYACRENILTSYSKEKHSQYQIYCEKCYIKEIN